MKFKTRLWLGALIYFVFIPSYPAYAQAQKEEIADKKFWLVNGALAASIVYDIESSYFVLGKCENCYEANPFMRPFVEAGRPQLYAVQGGIGAGISYASYEMKKSRRFKKVWWIIPVAATVAHTIAGTHNIRIAVKF